VSEAQANRRGARRPAEDLDPRRPRSTGYHWAFVHGCGQPEAPARRVTSRSRHCPSRTSLTVTGMVMTASYSDALSRRKARILLRAADRAAYRLRTGPRRRSDPHPRATQPAPGVRCYPRDGRRVPRRAPTDRAHPTATERCHYDHADVPAEIRCGPVECHVTGRPDGRDRESRPVGESPRWP
jgi:hypothetical protein